MANRCYTPVRVLTLSVAAALIAAVGFGGGVPAAHAMSQRPLDCTTTFVPGAIQAAGWIGGDMMVSFTGQTCGQTYSGEIQPNGNVVLPSAMLADTYTLNGTGSISGSIAGDCIVWSLTCNIANDSTHSSTFTIDASGNESINGYVFCQGYIAFNGAGVSIVIQGSGGSGFNGSGDAGPGAPTATPELSSSELLATGLVPTLGILWYRRRKRHSATGTADQIEQ